MRPLLRLALAALLAGSGLPAAAPAPAALSPAAAAGPAPRPLSPTAGGELAPLPARPELPRREKNTAWEDFAATTLVAAPFASFWCLGAALLGASLAQGRFPPDADRGLLAGAALAAGGLSLGVGLLSLSWGGPPRPAPQALSPSAHP